MSYLYVQLPLRVKFRSSEPGSPEDSEDHSELQAVRPSVVRCSIGHSSFVALALARLRRSLVSLLLLLCHSSVVQAAPR